MCIFREKPPVSIVLRQSPDWENITLHDFENQARVFCRLIGRPETLLCEVVHLWNTTFGISFFETRFCLKQIARQNLAQVSDAEIIPIAELTQIKEGIYVFIDDDDWLAPDLAQFFSPESQAEYDGFRWGSAVFGGHTQQAVFCRSYSDSFCYTNNYAISSRYLTLDNLENVSQHWKANHHFPSLRIAAIPHHLSITNKHPAATTCLERALAGQFSAENLKAIISQYNQQISSMELEKHPQLHWAKPYMQQTRWLYQQVLHAAT